MKMDDLWVRGNRGNPILGNPQTEFPFSLVQQEVNVEDIYEVSSLSPESAARTDHQRCDICRYLRHRNQVRRELQDRLKMFVRSRRGFAYGSKKHTSQEPEIFG